MKTTRSIPVILSFIVTLQLGAQDTAQKGPFQLTRQIDMVSVGLGGGLDYGGFGGNILYYPVKQVGLYGGAGYALAGLGFNAGLKFRYIPKKPESKVDPFALVMYGYNAAIAVSNASQHNKLFYGPSLGIGIDLRGKPAKRGYWSFALLVPIRRAAVKEYMEDLENNYGVEFQYGLFPLGGSVGYRFMIK
jgi:hypothetical protein